MYSKTLKEIEQLEREIRSLRARIDAIDDKVDNLYNYRGTSSEIDELNEESNRLENEKANLQKRLDELKASIPNQEKLKMWLQELQEKKENIEQQMIDIDNGKGNKEDLGKLIFERGSVILSINQVKAELKKLNPQNISKR